MLDAKTHRNEEELRRLYKEKRLSTYEIGNRLEVSASTIRYWLEKYNIERRDGGPMPNTLRGGYGESFAQILDGELLGDGCLTTNEGSEGAKYIHGTSRECYRDWLAELFSKTGFECWKNEYLVETKGSNYKQYDFGTLVYYELRDAYDRWYTHEGKVVPRDFELTPFSLRHWYIGDGSRSVEKNGKVTVTLSSYAFTQEERQCLVDELGVHGIDATAYQSGLIRIYKKSWDCFYSFMASLPDELEQTYGYKWPGGKNTSEAKEVVG